MYMYLKLYKYSMVISSSFFPNYYEKQQKNISINIKSTHILSSCVYSHGNPKDLTC